MKYRNISLLSAECLFADLNQEALPVIVPFLIKERNDS